MSVSRRASKERAKALNSESLYMTPLWFVIVLARIVTGEGLTPTHGPESSPILSPIGYPPTPSRQYVKIWASTGLWPRNCQPFVRANPLCAAFSSRALPDLLPLPPWQRADPMPLVPVARIGTSLQRRQDALPIQGRI